MNAVEFINHIKEEYKDKLPHDNIPGTLTDDDLLSIFNESKLAYISDRSVPGAVNGDSLRVALVKAIGWRGTPASLDGYRRRLATRNINSQVRETTCAAKHLINETSSTIHSQIPDSPIDHEKYKNITKDRDILTKYRSTLRDEARIEVWKDDIISHIDALNKLPEVSFVQEKNTLAPSKTEAVLLFSDLHIGVMCDNFYNKYNADIAEARVNKLVQSTITYCKLNNVEKLNVLNLGDMIQGLIHINSRIDEEMTTVEQIIRASAIVTSALNALQAAAKVVTYRSVVDNHSRSTANLEEHIEKDNFNKLVDLFVEERLKGTKVQFPHDNIDDGIGKFTLDNGKKVMFSHGHQDNMNQSFQHFVGATNEFTDYIFLAHFHSEKFKSFQGMKVFVNGSVVGTEQYALGLRLFNKPAQTLLVFNKDDDTISDTSIDLSKLGAN